MVQLPATAAIEYVAAGHFSPGVFWPGALLAGGIFVREGFSGGGLLYGGSFARGLFPRGDFCPGGFFSGRAFPGGLLPEGTFVRGAYALSPQVQCVYAPSRLSVRSIVARRTNKQKNDKKTHKLGLLAPRGVDPLPKFSGYVEVDADYIFHSSSIWVRPLRTELGPKNPSKMPILP